MATKQPFSQVNVFSPAPLGGNPLAVVHDADGLSDEHMARLARWTNLSETTFILRPTDPGADYRVRIFSPGGELPFAGHPTLGTCHAWLNAGGVPRLPDLVVQQCEIGRVRVRCDGPRLQFSAPPLKRTGPLDDELLATIAGAFRIPVASIVDHQWVDNGPGWCAVRLPTAAHVLAIEPDWSLLKPLRVGAVGAYGPGEAAQLEVRAFVGDGGYEDPVTGSLNASMAQWLIGTGAIRPPYVVAQGTKLGRAGSVHVAKDGVDVWVGGDVVDVVQGFITL